MNKDLVKRIALLALLWSTSNVIQFSENSRLVSFLALSPHTAYAAISEEERILRRAEQDLIEAQHKVIEAQRALLEKQRRQLEGRGVESPVPAARPQRETNSVKRHSENYKTQRAETPPVQQTKPSGLQRNEKPSVQKRQKPADLPVQKQPRQQVPETVAQPLPEIVREVKPEKQTPVTADTTAVSKQPATSKPSAFSQAPSAPGLPAGTPPAVAEHKANQQVLNDDAFANAVWKENNGGVANVTANAPVKETTKADTLLSGWTAADIDTLRKQNNGVLATEEKMIYTTDPSIMFTFTGMTRKKSVDSVLNALKQVNGKGTFFVTERELQRNPDTIREIAARGQEIGICISPKPDESFGDICADILRAKQMLKKQYGKDSNLVKQFSGVIQDVTREAVSAVGCRLISANMNVVQSRHKDYQVPEQILPEIMGKAVYSLGRGWIVNIRMDFYKKPELAAEMLLYLKRKKIDNIAYNAFDDVAGLNPQNDSAYRLRSVGEVLSETTKLWNYPVPASAFVPGVERHPLLPPNASHEQLVEEMSKRYFGEGTINAQDRTLGFTEEDFLKLDTTGTVKTDDNVIFLTFDDWGHDSSINPLLYVLRKHGVPATFFILTHNVIYNPNLLRAIALEGHDIASHTNMHKPMATEDEKEVLHPTMSYEEYYSDMNTSYNRLASIVGDLQWPDGRPVLTKFMRPPTLAVSSMGIRAILENGFEYIINGSASTEDYEAHSLEQEIKIIRDGLYYRDKLRKGAIFVMHMTTDAKFTPYALDVILTANEKKSDNDPTKFKVGLLSDYLDYGYSQGKTKKQLTKEKRKINWW
jgi:peptidoglycan/xylan/chitin deacetylase (PgdA/CDA1 family)